MLASPVAVTPPAAGHATAAAAEIEAVGFAVSECTVSEYNSFPQVLSIIIRRTFYQSIPWFSYILA